MSTTRSMSDAAQLDQHDVRALTQYLTVLEDLPRVDGADDLYVVVSESGSSYLVDAREGACECADHRYRDVECKHIRRVAFATGRREIPEWVDEDAIDPDLGRHVTAVDA